MADIARCLCPHDSTGHKCGRNLGCPFHGNSSKDPLITYLLNWNDKRFLHSLRIDPDDSAAIQAVRQADEDRFRP